MKLNKIAFDLDGVLADVFPVIEAHLYDLYGDDGVVIDSGQFRIQTTGNLSRNKVWAAIKLMYKDVHSVDPEFGAAVVLNQLYVATGNKTRVITARPEKYRLDTQILLSLLFPGVPIDLVMVPGPDKIDHLKGIQFFVEDRRRNAKHIAAAGKTVFLIDRPYNKMDKDPEGIIRIASLYEIIRHEELFHGEAYHADI